MIDALFGDEFGMGDTLPRDTMPPDPLREGGRCLFSRALLVIRPPISHTPQAQQTVMPCPLPGRALDRPSPEVILMNATTVKEAQKNLDRLIALVNADAEPTIICSDQGQQAVLLSLAEFHSWQETLYLLANPSNAAHLRQSIAEAQAGHRDEQELIEP